MAVRTAHVSIEGRVQGVGFRGWARREAERRGLSGWVRNRRDGSVELLVTGPASLVDEMLSACRRGPRVAEVRAVTDLGPAPTPPAGSFTILATH